MEVRVDLAAADPAPVLAGAEDLGSLEVSVEGAGSMAELAAALGPLGVLDGDGENALLDVEALAALAGELAADPGWRSGYDAMIAYAASRGWVDAAGRVQAHIERRAGSDPR